MLPITDSRELLQSEEVENAMRFRKVAHSDGLPHEDITVDETKLYRRSLAKGRLGRLNGRFLLTFAAAILVVTVTAISKFRSGPRTEGSWSLFSTDRGGGKYESARGHRKKAKTRRSSSSSSPDSPDAHCTRSHLEKRSSHPKYGCKEIEEMVRGDMEYLGHGYWRDVYLVEYRGQKLVVKTLRDDQKETKRNRERHRWEAVAMDAVKDSPNVVHLLGKCDSDMVTEYYPKYLDLILMGESSDSSDEPNQPVDLVELTLRRIIAMALDAARGLQALHEADGGPIVHADLQPRQLLVDDQGVVKINDLNRCRFMAKDEHGNSCPFKINKGNGAWRSPEEHLEEYGVLTEKIDIYSMGMIFWSMYGREEPFKRDDTMKERVAKGERPRIDTSWHQGFVQLFQEMWNADPSKRPSAGQVVKRLETMLKELPQEA